jgi:ribosomal-protein-alanine N-acetyltransferase
VSEGRMLASERLELPVWGADAIEALIDGDGERLAALTGAVWPAPLVAPPEMDDALPFFAERSRADPAAAHWWARLLVERETRRVVGSSGFVGPPDADGVVTTGYAVYPADQGRGYAGEAVRALVGWALRQPGVRRVRATIHPTNLPSRRVAEKAGLRLVGRMHDETDGDLDVWETER